MAKRSLTIIPKAGLLSVSYFRLSTATSVPAGAETGTGVPASRIRDASTAWAGRSPEVSSVRKSIYAEARLRPTSIRTTTGSPKFPSAEESVSGEREGTVFEPWEDSGTEETAGATGLSAGAASVRKIGLNSVNPWPLHRQLPSQHHQQPPWLLPEFH